MAFVIKNTRDLAPLPRVLLYGAAGAGKTTLAASAPEPLFLVPELGTDELTGLKGAEISYVTFRTQEEFKRLCGDISAQARAGKLPAKTLVIDNLTTIQTLIEHEIMKSQEGTSAGDDRLSQRNWGKFSATFTSAVMELHKAPCTIVWITHEKLVQIPSEVKGQPDTVTGGYTLMGKTGSFLPGICSAIVRMMQRPEKGKPAFYAYLRPHDFWTARVRISPDLADKLPQKIGPNIWWEDLAAVCGWSNPPG